MELIRNELMAERVVYSGVAQAMVEGEIPQIEDRIAGDILSATGDVLLMESAITENAVQLSGRVSVQLICAGENGPFAFTSRADFTHNMPAQGAMPGMLAEAAPMLQALEVTLTDGRIRMGAVVDIALQVLDSTPLQTFGGIRGAQELELLTDRFTAAKRETVFHDVLRLREEVDAAGAAAVLQSDVTVALRELRRDGRGVELNGILTVSALVEDKEGRLFQLTQNLPLNETLDVFAASDADLHARAQVLQADVQASQEFGMLVADLRLAVSLFARSQSELILPQDAFSPALPFTCEQEAVQLCSYGGESTLRHAISETVSVPNGLPEINRVIYAAARPVVTGGVPQDGQLYAEGLLITRVLYESDTGALHAFTEDIPFHAGLPAGQDSTHALLWASATASAAGSGRAAEVRFSLNLHASLYAFAARKVVTGISQCAGAEVPEGIIVYFAGAGETLYDVAKRFCIPREKLRAAQPGLQETLEEGQKLVFLR
ncbi:MAG: DUF3794 domain-containing protein [Christensenellaceae bacterium]|jgi:hypothetical protein|nr:DUF3794 domain-containing protein [Christensenellaceae bacterium]